jgi:pimeloyl-ACP methyl ester carboxylesterase
MIIPLTAGQLYQQAMQGSTTTILDQCGHMPEMEKPVEFVNVVLDFLTTGS